MHTTKITAERQARSTGAALFFSAATVCLALLVSGCGRDTVKSAECDILIVGGGTGGVAAALQASMMADEWGVGSILMTEETSWPGGQYTSQGVTASDDNSLVEQGRYDVGASELFFRLHDGIRNLYRPKALETARTTGRNGGPGSKAREMEIEWIEGDEFSPGNAWGSRMSFLPKDGVMAMETMLAPYVESGLLGIRYRTVPVGVIREGRRVAGVLFRDLDSGDEYGIRAKITIDATELGDLFPLAGIDYRIGIEASEDTGEPSLFDDNGEPLYPEPMPGCVQSFTYPFAVEWGPENEDNRRPWEERPASYEENHHRFTMIDNNRWFLMTRWNDHSRAEIWEKNRRTGGNEPLTWIPSFWTYRRMLDARILNPDLSADPPAKFLNGGWKTDFAPDSDPRYFIPNWQYSPPAVGDIIEVNWISNDYNGGNIVDVTPEERERALREAKELSLGFMFWLWYEAPRDPEDPRLDPSVEANWSIDPVTGKNTGWANLKLRPDVMGTEDGLSMYPYIRESRRMRGLYTVRQQDLMGPRTERARLFHDTVGIGHYFLDIHRCDVGCERKRDIHFKHVQLSDGSWAGENSSGRFQIPYGSLVPEQVDGMLAAAKNISLTRIAASTYRLHPVEFEIGKAAGAAAVMCVNRGLEPRDLWVKSPDPASPGEEEKRLRELQQVLLSHNTPLFWNEDAGWDTDVFGAVQWACLLEIMEPHERNFEPDVPLTRREAVMAAARLSGRELTDGLCSVTFTDIDPGDGGLREAVTIIESTGALDWTGNEYLEPDREMRAGEFALMLEKCAGGSGAAAGDAVLTRGGAAAMMLPIIRERYGL